MLWCNFVFPLFQLWSLPFNNMENDNDCIKQGKLTAQAKSLAANARGLM